MGKIVYSTTHSISLFDALGTEACTSENLSVLPEISDFKTTEQKLTYY